LLAQQLLLYYDVDADFINYEVYFLKLYLAQ